MLKSYTPFNVSGFLLLLLLFSHPVMSSSLWFHWLQRARPPCPSPSPGVCPSSCSLHWWCRPAISSSDTLFSFCPQSFPASETFNESSVRIRWPNFWSFSFRISSSSEYSGLISLMSGWFDLLDVQVTFRSLLSTTVQRHQFIRFLLPTSKYTIISALHRSLYKCDFSSPVNFPPAYPILILLIIHMDSSMDLWLKPLPHGINSI